jgi:hypothetical protein
MKILKLHVYQLLECRTMQKNTEETEDKARNTSYHLCINGIFHALVRPPIRKLST